MSKKNKTSYDPIEEANQRLLNALTQLKEARQIHKAFMSLGQELSLGSRQEVLLKIISEAVRSLFPGVFFLVQLGEPHRAEAVSLEYEGPLKPGAGERMHVTRSAVRKTRLTGEATRAACIEIMDKLPRLFEDSSFAIHAPLVAECQLYGVIHLESSPERPLADDDEVLLISLANQMALALRNQRLLDETVYLKEYMENILEHANALITVTDQNRRILVFNRAMERRLGFPKAEMLGTDLFRWVPPADSERLADEFHRVLRGGASSEGIEVRMRSREGELVEIIFYPAALHDREGQISSIILVGRDLTMLRSLERQVVEAEKMASMGKLAAGVAHELNNPLTSITVYAEYLVQKLASGKVDASDTAKAEKILEGAQRIQKLTRDLVSYSRPTSEEPEPLEFNEVVEQGLSFCEHIISKYDVRLSRELGTSLGRTLGNRNRLLQVVINLISNACQAMEGGGELTVSTRRDGSWIVMGVTDTGTGISEKDLEHIFEPFFTTKKPGEGTGLGLSIVSRIIEHHRGSIRVKSQPGVGTAFEVWLPVIGAEGS